MLILFGDPSSFTHKDQILDDGLVEKVFIEEKSSISRSFDP
jgi:hypothetical protein